jgi:nitrous oxidase accessory protein
VKSEIICSIAILPEFIWKEAVRIQASCDDNTFEKSNFFSNTFDVSTNGSLVLNRFDGNYWDRYEGYDLNRDGKGDIPFHPMNFFSMVVERMPTLMFLWRSFFVQMLDRAEKIIPEALRDNYPSIKPYDLLKSN